MTPKFTCSQCGAEGEVVLEGPDGRYVRLKSYPPCGHFKAVTNAPGGYVLGSVDVAPTTAVPPLASVTPLTGRHPREAKPGAVWPELGQRLETAERELLVLRQAGLGVVQALTAPADVASMTEAQKAARIEASARALSNLFHTLKRTDPK